MQKKFGWDFENFNSYGKPNNAITVRQTFFELHKNRKKSIAIHFKHYYQEVKKKFH